jgi:hypothetical protein
LSKKSDPLTLPDSRQVLCAYFLHLTVKTIEISSERTVFFLTQGNNVILHKRIYLLVPAVLYGVGLMYYLYDDLAKMRLPVIL